MQEKYSEYVAAIEAINATKTDDEEKEIILSYYEWLNIRTIEEKNLEINNLKYNKSAIEKIVDNTSN